MKDLFAQVAVSVIVPTMASPERADLLKRAVKSIVASTVDPIKIIVVVNGTRFDDVICNWLKAQDYIKFVYVATPSSPNAILVGRKHVDTEFFSCLDDDDEYLEGATDKKVAILRANPGTDLLVSDAYQRSVGGDRVLYGNLEDVPPAPLEALMNYGWLTSGNMLYRSRSVTVSYFEESHPYAEWTWLAFKLSMGGKSVIALNEPTCRYNDTVASLSKSNEYFKSYIPLFKRMLECRPPKRIAQMIRRKLGDAFHDASGISLRAGKRYEAWQFHFQSVCTTGGRRYVAYTRHLLK